MSKLDIDQLEHDINSVLLRIARLLKRYKHLTAVIDETDADIGDRDIKPANVPIPLVHPTVTVLDAQAFPIVQHVHTTCWLNGSDDASGETDKQPMYPWAPRNAKKVGLTVVGAAVPMHVSQGDHVRVRHANGNDAWVYIPIIEGGPHRTSDDYLKTGERPLAEAQDKNRAGLDLTPAAMALVNGKSAQENYDSEPSIALDVQFVPGAKVPGTSEPSIARDDLRTAIVRAARALPVPFPYAPETDHGKLGCADVVTTALHNAGVAIRVILGVDDAVAALRHLGWHDVPIADWTDGDVIVWASTEESSGHKHIGILAHRSGDLTAINNSSSQEKVVEVRLSEYQRPIERVLSPP